VTAAARRLQCITFTERAIHPAFPSRVNRYASDEWLAGCGVVLVGCPFVTAAAAVAAAASSASTIEPRPTSLLACSGALTTRVP